MSELSDAARKAGLNGGRGDNVVLVRASEKADFSGLMDFYATNSHPDVHPRQEEVMHERISDGSFLVIEEAGQCIGAGGRYDLFSDEATAGVKCCEFGTGRMAGRNGYGLYSLMLSLHVMDAALVDERGIDSVVQSTTSDAHRVNQVLAAHGGWENMPWPEQMWKAIHAMKTDGHAVECDSLAFYRASGDLLPYHARTVLDFFDQAERGDIVVDMESLPLFQPNKVDLLRLYANPPIGMVSKVHFGYDQLKTDAQNYLKQPLEQNSFLPEFSIK